MPFFQSCAALTLAATCTAAPGVAQDGASAELADLSARYEASEGQSPERYRSFRAEYASFAERHAGSDEALTARLWLLNQSWWLREEGTMHGEARKQLAAILDGYAASPRLAEVMSYEYVFSPADRDAAFTRILGMTPHDSVKAAALLSLGKLYARSHDEERRLEARARLELLQEKYGKLPYRQTTFGAMATAHLDPHDAAELAIGKVAPEIAGVDLDGRPMKLSDYRGKVVVLDFWGDW